MKPDKQEIKRNPDGTFPPGVSGNPNGRPPGQTMKEFAREFYLLKTPEEKREYIEGVEAKRPGFAWEMGEGKADSKTNMDITTDGQPIGVVVLPQKNIDADTLETPAEADTSLS